MQNTQNPGQPALYYQGRYYSLDRPQMIIGSAPDCDVCIENNSRVLPRHAQIISQNGHIFLMYMERGAGIWINGAPASQQQLQDQDEIALGSGETRLKLLLNGTANGASTQSNGKAEETQILRGGTPAERPSAALPKDPYTVGLAPQQMPPAVAAPLQPTGQMPPATPPLGAALGGAQAPAQQMVFAPQPQQGPQAAFTPQPPAQALGFASNTATNTTRYLCAAGHLDEEFQDYVLCHVIHEERRALGESYGVDMLAVVSWCKAGRARANMRDTVLGVLFLGIASLIVFKTLQLLGPAVQQINQENQYYAQMGYTVPPQTILLQLLTAGLALPLILLVTLLVSLGIEVAIKHRWRNSHPGFLSLLVLMWLLSLYVPFWVSFLLTLAIWATIFIELVMRYYGEPINRLRKGAFNPQHRPVPLDFQLETKLRENFTTGQRNVVAYSGYKPFAGAGYYQNGWSFVIDISQGAPDPAEPETRLTPRPFTISSLYDTIEKDVRALGINDVLEIEGKLYVRGQFLPENPPFFNAAAIRPVTSIDPRMVERYKEHPTEDVRYYQCLRFNFWRGEMVFTTFLRFIQRGKDLFTEVDYLLLPPMKDEYYWIDRKEITPTLEKVWQLFKYSFNGPINMWFGVPKRLLRSSTYVAEQQRLARIAPNNPAFDYGARTSLRWEASDDTYHLFFQKLDEEMYLKIIEKQILETMACFLEAHQIDTAELRERQQTILNNNTYVNGDGNTISGLASGIGAQANNNTAQSSRAGGRVQAQAKP